MMEAARLGKYHVLDRVTVGGMAEIYRAISFEDSGQERMVAIKRILPHLAEDEQFIRMLIEEAKIAGTIAHPNVAEIYELGIHDGSYFIAMEFVIGRDLRALIDRARLLGISISISDAVYIATQMLNGLYAAHTQRGKDNRPLKIIHRDVSPANILVSFKGRVKIIDFGIAKATYSSVHTRTGLVKGKVRYMSPEQAWGKTLNERSDQFSVGTITYELLTGRPPFDAEQEIDVFQAVRAAKCRPLGELRPDLPLELERILQRMMAKRALSRYRNAKAAQLALLKFLFRHEPTYSRKQAALLMRQLFEADIEEEYQKIQKYTLK